MRVYRYLLIFLVFQCAFGNVSGNTAADRINETVRFGQSFGLWIDASVALNQKQFLDLQHYAAFFNSFADLTSANLENYTFLYPYEFWAINRYLTRLYTDNHISPTELAYFREATIIGIKNFQDLQSASVRGLSDSSKKSPAVTRSPELDYFVELITKSTDPELIEELIQDDIEDVIDTAIEDTADSMFSEWFPNTRIRSSVASGMEPQFEVGFITPLVDRSDFNLFGQTMISLNDHGHQFSQGIGYRGLDRHLINVFGANVFVDYQPDTDHTRASIGIEMLSNSKKLYANRYIPLSGYKQGPNRSLQRPADGYDASAYLAVPYFPGLYIAYAIEAWNYGADKKSMTRSFGIKGELTPKLTLEIQHQKSLEASTERVLANLTYNYLSDGHPGTAPYELRAPEKIFDDYRYQFVERDYSMPLSTACPSVSFTNSSFETDQFNSQIISGWTNVNKQVILGTSIVAGALTPIDSSYPNSSPGDSEPATIGSIQTLIVGESSDGDRSVRLLTNGVTSSSFAVVRGPAIFSSKTVNLEPGDLVTFDWKAENGEDNYDVFGYFYNESTGQSFEVLNETGTITDWNTETFKIPVSGDYRFVFISGSYDATGGQALGASLYLDNVAILSDRSVCEDLQNR